MRLLRVSLFALALAGVCDCSYAVGQFAAGGAANSSAPKILKIDPPNWWARMPKPMLLIRGENLTSAKASLSDARLTIEKTKISENGHWVELWLDATPSTPETVTIRLRTASGAVSAPYRFEKRRAEDDGFAGFSSKGVMYLIMTDRFADGDTTNDGTPAEHAAELAKPRGWHGGDLRGIEQHIGYLKDLGVDAVWMTPVYQNHGPESYHGYGATDMYAVDEHYGTLEDLKRLSQALHQQKMKMVLDTVPNHIGPTHPWVTDEPEPDWFHGTSAHHSVAQGDFKPLTDPHAPWRDQHDVTQGWFANILPDMNQENPAVARYLIQNVMWWVEETGADGLRIDTFPYVGRKFWNDFHAELHALYPRLTSVGEVFNGDPTITSSFAGGVTRNGIDTGLDTPFDFPTYFAIRDTLLHDAPMSKLAEILRMDALYPHPERLVPFLGNHDTSRFLNDPAATPAKLELAFTLLATMRGMPELYSGDEIAMRGGDDPDNRRDFPGGFPGDGQANAFDPQTRSPEQKAMFDAVKRLLAIRRSQPSLMSGEEQVIHSDDNTLVYVRAIESSSGATDRVLVAVNKSKDAQKLAIDISGTWLEGADASSMLLGDSKSVTLSPGTLQVNLPAVSEVIATIN